MYCLISLACATVFSYSFSCDSDIENRVHFILFCKLGFATLQTPAKRFPDTCQTNLAQHRMLQTPLTVKASTAKTPPKASKPAENTVLIKFCAPF
jgi:hypothetical protein